MSFLLDGILKHIGHYNAVLPYNLNWMRKNWKPVESFCQKDPIVVFDIGARGGGVEELTGLEDCINYVAFDADEEECELLNKASFKWMKYCAYPYFIGEKEEEIEFHLYKRPGESSVLKPNQRYKKEWGGDDFGIEKTVSVPSISLEKVQEKESLPSPDFLKIDTQGSELRILRSSENLLDEVSLIEAEVEFVTMYEGQDLYHHLADFLYSKGMELLYLNRCYKNRHNKFEKFARGQLIFADALFVKNEVEVAKMSTNKKVKLILLLVQYGHLDYAYHIWENNHDIEKIAPGIKSLFTVSPKGGIFSKLVRVLVLQLDKLICFLLFLRKHNHIGTDSDRSWPTR